MLIFTPEKKAVIQSPRGTKLRNKDNPINMTAIRIINTTICGIKSLL